MGLNNKQQAFLSEYLLDFNATQAAIRAGYSERSARSTGVRMLTNANISAEIKLRLAEKAMKSDEILERLADIARADMGDYLDVSSLSFQINLAKAKEQNKLRFIRRLKQKTTTICREGGEDVEQNQIDFELMDQLRALELLGRANGLFVDRHEMKMSGPVEIVIKRVDAKRAEYDE